MHFQFFLLDLCPGPGPHLNPGDEHGAISLRTLCSRPEAQVPGDKGWHDGELGLLSSIAGDKAGLCLAGPVVVVGGYVQ